MTIDKSLLKGTLYEWTGVHYMGEPTRRLFDRHNGEQMLFVLNFFAGQQVNFSLDQISDLESTVLNKLPIDIKSELSVIAWLQANYQPAHIPTSSI